MPVSGVSSRNNIACRGISNMGWLPGVQELEETSKCLEIMTPLIVNVTHEIRRRGRRLD